MSYRMASRKFMCTSPQCAHSFSVMINPEEPPNQITCGQCHRPALPVRQLPQQAPPRPEPANFDQNSTQSLPSFFHMSFTFMNRDGAQDFFSDFMSGFPQQQHEPQTKPTDKNFVENLPAPDSVVEDQECCICLEQMDRSKGCQLPCGHKFDRACLSKWLEESSQCPCCRH